MTSKVEQVRRYVFRAIRAGELVGRIPTEVELCKRFGVSHGTVRAALKQLIDAGHLIAKRGAGVFVNQNCRFTHGRKLIATIVADVKYSFYSDLNLSLLSSVMRAVQSSQGLYLSLDELAGDVEELPEALERVMPDGVIWLYPRYENIVKLQKLDIPMLALWALTDLKYKCELPHYPPEVNGVFADRFEEGRLYARRCLDDGFKKLLVIKLKNYREMKDDQFFQGIFAAFEETGLDRRRNLSHLTPDRLDSTQLLRLIKNGFNGIYCDSAMFTFTRDFLESEGLRPDNDYRLLTRTQSPMVPLRELRNCELIDFPLETMALEAVKRLNRQIDSDESTPEQVLMSPRIIRCDEYLKKYI